jgi:hypothetical protein
MYVHIYYVLIYIRVCECECECVCVCVCVCMAGTNGARSSDVAGVTEKTSTGSKVIRDSSPSPSLSPRPSPSPCPPPSLPPSPSAGSRSWVSGDKLAESSSRTGGHVEAYLARLEGERVRLEHTLLIRVKDVARERASVDKARNEALALRHELTKAQQKLSDEQQVAASLRDDVIAAAAKRDQAALALHQLHFAHEQLRVDADAAKSLFVHKEHADKTADSQQVCIVCVRVRVYLRVYCV